MAPSLLRGKRRPVDPTLTRKYSPTLTMDWTIYCSIGNSRRLKNCTIHLKTPEAARGASSPGPFALRLLNLTLAEVSRNASRR